MTAITISARIKQPVEKTWEFFNNPEHVVNWNYADPSWHCPYAENDLKTGGKFNYRMEAKDGSYGFDFWGVYDNVVPYKTIEYTMGDGRKVWVKFEAQGNETFVETRFEPESSNPLDMQQAGWQSILNNFAGYCESKLS